MLLAFIVVGIERTILPGAITQPRGNRKGVALVAAGVTREGVPNVGAALPLNVTACIIQYAVPLIVAAYTMTILLADTGNHVILRGSVPIVPTELYGCREKAGMIYPQL
jgi:hypothetical protein